MNDRPGSGLQRSAQARASGKTSALICEGMKVIDE